MCRAGGLVVAAMLVSCHKNGPTRDRDSIGDIPLYPGSSVISMKSSGGDVRAVVAVPAPVPRVARYYRNLLFRRRWGVETRSLGPDRMRLDAARGLDRLELVIEIHSRAHARLTLHRWKRTETEALVQEKAHRAARSSPTQSPTGDATGERSASDLKRGPRITDQAHPVSLGARSGRPKHKGDAVAFAYRLPKDIHVPDGWHRYRDPRLNFGVTFRNESRNMGLLVRGVVGAMRHKGWARIAGSGKTLGGPDFRVLVFSNKHRTVTMRLTRGLDGTFMRILIVGSR